MAAGKLGLGKGIDLLIPQEPLSDQNPINRKPRRKTKTSSEKKKDNETVLKINQIEPNRNQPRKQFDEDAIDELADSIKQYGVLQPLIVQKKDDYYEIIAGERRWRASKKAGLKEVPVIIKEYTDKDRLKISLIENIQRENLNSIEEAKAYQSLKEEFGLKQDEIANSVSKSRAAITNTLRLLKLDERVQGMILDDRISSGHGRTLLAIEDGEVQYELAVRILDESLSVRETEKLVKKVLANKENNPEDQTKKLNNNPMIPVFEERIKHILGSKVSIKNKKNNKGKIEIEYYSADELERIIDLIQNIPQ